ncbi:MAG: hypothetical protein RL846_29750 [Deltaproteobacteria bacterium]
MGRLLIGVAPPLFALLCGAGCRPAMAVQTPDYANRRFEPTHTDILFRSTSVELDADVPTSGMTTRRVQALYQKNAAKFFVDGANRAGPLGETRRFRSRGGVPSLLPRELPIREARDTWHVPADGETLDSEAGVAPLVLIIDRFELGYAEAKINFSPGGGSVEPPILFHRAHFALWDNEAGALVTYGRAIVNGPAALDAKTFRAVIIEMVDKFLRVLPLE